MHLPEIGDVRVPIGSVVPTPKNPLGTTLVDFMDELEATVEEQGGKPPLNPPVGVEGDDSDEDGRRDPRDPRDSRAADGFATLDRRLATLPRHAPWIPDIVWTVQPNAVDTSLDLSVNDRVFDDFTRAFRMSRIGALLKKREPKFIVTLILESEMDVWSACGGSTNKLPKKTWITRRGEGGPSVGFEDDATVDDPRDVATKFEKWATDTEKTKPWVNTLFGDAILNDEGELTSRRSDPFYMSGTGTLEGQINRFLTKNYTSEVVDAFKMWMKGKEKGEKERRGVLPTDIVDVLFHGGFPAKKDDAYDPTGVAVREAADRLVATALFCGAATSGDNALQEMLFQNHRRLVVKKGIRLQLDEAGKQSLARAASAFRAGKEKILRELTIRLVETATHGGPEATLITNPDQRRRFMLLCRANHELNIISRQQFASDRRARASERARIKRECLYYFQTMNGTERRIDPQFVM